jgi:hypothetical protein
MKEINLLINIKSRWEKYLTKKEVMKIFQACNIDVQEILEIKSRQIINNKEYTAKVHVKTRSDDNRIDDNIVLISFRLGPPTWDQFIRTTYRSGSNAGIRIIIHEGNASYIGELVGNNNLCGLKTYLIEAKGLIQRIFEGKAQQIDYSYENGPIVNENPPEPLLSIRQVQESEFWTCYYLPAWGESSDKPMGLYGNREEWAKLYRDLSLPVIWNDDGLHINLTGDPDSELIKMIWKNKLGEVTIVTHWQIGQTINSFYHGKYGTNELGRISEATGIGRDTLAKACKFAKQYSKENVEMLLRGNFVMSWYQIAQHLTIEPQKVIETYRQSPDPKQFYNGIIKLKSPSEVRGKSKPPKTVEVKDAEKPIIVATEIMSDESVIAEYDEPHELAKHYEAYEKELEMLKLENERLEKEILSRDVKVRELEKALSDVQREKERYENSYYDYMHKMDKVRAGLENNTPVRAIMEWIDQGDDE